jgi:hypothetical protein
MSALLELNLSQSKMPAMGYAAHVPHYLAATDYPKAAVALLDQIALATGLVIPRDELRTAAIAMDEDLDRQIESVSENIEVVSSLETQHDNLMQSRHELTADGQLVSGEELAASFEQYLAEIDEKGETES